MSQIESEIGTEQGERTNRNGRSNENDADDVKAEGRTTQVLEFDLGDETYCVDIRYVAEIVDMDEFTAVPNSPRHVEGVMDLRGRTTSIIDPKVLYGIAEEGDRKRIIVFDPAELDSGSATGWVVDEVDQVIRISENDVDGSPVVDDESIRGIVKRDGEFTLWVDPDTASS
jgi:purine-binding chemotaxis protein CheW